MPSVYVSLSFTLDADDLEAQGFDLLSGEDWEQNLESDAIDWGEFDEIIWQRIEDAGDEITVEILNDRDEVVKVR